MPSLGADMESGTLVEWLKKPGDTVSKGDIMAVVETQKGAIEIEIFQDGVIDKLLADPGQKVPVGMPLALVNGGIDEEALPPSQPTPSREPERPVAPVVPDIALAPAAGRIRISPAARKHAAALGIDVSTVMGSGPGGAITLSDIETLARAGGATEEKREVSPKAAMRDAIAAAMTRSNREIPHYHLDNAVDAGPLMDWLETRNAELSVTQRLLHGALFLKAVALALREAPDLNGFWEDGAFRSVDEINIGWAVSLRGGGLIAPAILGTDRLTLVEVMTALRDLVKRARSGGLRSSELSQATITVTSLGDTGVDAVHGVIYPPQVALVGFGRIERKPWVVEDTVVPRPVVMTSLAADHRASDGQRGAKFLNALANRLQEPEKL